MPKIKIFPLARSIAIALIFFAIGRVIVAQMGSTGFWMIAILLTLFYFGWWLLYRRERTGK